MSVLSTTLRYYRTLRHLRPIQFYGRARVYLYRPRPRLSPAPRLRPREGRYRQPAEREPSLKPGDTWRFLGEERVFRGADDWNAPQVSKLWLYNLHYFNDLNARDAGHRREVHRRFVQRWVEENPAGQGVGWEPYPTSIRIVNWIGWALGGETLEPAWHDSLAAQARWLRHHLEWHLLGNHLFSNAKALVFAGAYFTGAEPEHWLRRGLALLERELREQVLADGGHFERSPMYHALAIEDLLDLVNLAGVYPDCFPRATLARWRSTAPRMLSWLSAMCHPDGQIAFFNDAALDVAPPRAALSSYAARLGIEAAQSEDSHRPVTVLAESGYVRVECGPSVAILDVAPVGPDYLPGHAHADTLCFELSLDGSRLFVNSGTSVYAPGQERLRQRGTPAHNTVEIDGVDSSEVWGSFRVARRARPLDFAIARDGERLRVRCAHDGYLRLPGRVVHHREWIFTTDGLTVRDSLQGRWRSAVARFHLHPSVAVEATSKTAGVLLSGKRRVDWRLGSGEARVVEGRYHPRFGQAVPNQCLEVILKASVAEVVFSWT